MFLNRANITLINQVKKKAQGKGHAFAQTNSRLDGNYLKAARIYRTASDKGKPTRAIWSGNKPEDFRAYLKGRSRKPTTAKKRR